MSVICNTCWCVSWLVWAWSQPDSLTMSTHNGCTGAYTYTLSCSNSTCLVETLAWINNLIFTGIGCCPPTRGWGWLPAQGQTAKPTDVENQNSKVSTQTQSSRENVSQVRFHITLSTKNFDQALFHEILKNSCLESYKDASYFQITLKGFGSELWSMQGHICFRKDVKRRNARTRLREKFLASFKQLSLPSG